MRTTGQTRALHGKKSSTNSDALATAGGTAVATKPPKIAPKVPSRVVDTGDMDSGAGADEPEGADRRRSGREQVFAMGVPGMLRELDEANDCRPVSQPLQIMVVDVSLHGVGFRSPVKLERDALFLVEIGVGPLHLSSRIILARVRPRNDGTWDIGGEFC